MVTTTTLLVTAAVLAVVGSGVSAYGMYAQGQSQKKMADYNAQVQNNNAVAARQEASFEADRIRERNTRLRGAQVAAASKSGLAISGSVGDVMYDSALSGELDALTAIYKGDSRSGNYLSQAEMSTYSGNAAVQSSYFNSGGTILGGLGQAGGYAGQIKTKNSPTLA